jgi:hypothetical protein
LASVKSAFHSQKLVLADLKVSEDLLTDFMKEVVTLANGAEKEIINLTQRLKEYEALFDPTQLICALDLAGVEAPRHYICDVRSRLEKGSLVASEAIGELHVRQKQFYQWKNKRLQVSKETRRGCGLFLTSSTYT